MKHWTQPELMELKVSETACGWFPWYPGHPGGDCQPPQPSEEPEEFLS